MPEENNDFHDTMRRVSSVDQAKIERLKKEKEEEPAREPWHRRQEDRLAFEQARRKAIRDEIQKWVILLMLFVSLLIGDSRVFQIAKSLVLG